MDADLDGYMDYRAQLVMGWLKRVIDRVNPYEARISDFTEIVLRQSLVCLLNSDQDLKGR